MSATYTVKQVAEILGYSTNSIYTFLKEKRLSGVRVGKGRFRIPQSELDRLLGTQKQLVTAPLESPVSYEAPQVPYHFQPVFQTPRVEVPSLFDWFVGMASIILGLAMFLFSRVNEEFAISQYVALMPVIRITFIAGGFGILFTDVIGKRRHIWHVIFHAVLVSAYAVYSLILLRSGTYDGVALYGSMTVLLVLYTVFHLDGLTGFSAYVGLLLSVLLISSFVTPSESGISRMIWAIPWMTGILYQLMIVCIVIVALLVTAGKTLRNGVFRFGMLCTSGIMAALSLYFAQNLLWGRSLYVLFIAILACIVPVWQRLSFAHKRDRMFVFGAFGSILSLFVIAVGAVRIMQTNVLSYAGHELDNKVMFGKFLVESAFSGATSSLSSAANNPIVIEGLSKDNSDILLSFLKNFFESNQSMNKIVLLNKQRERVVEYPHEITQKNSLANSDVVMRALATKAPTMSDSFEPVGNILKRKTVIIAVPVITAKNEIIGVIVGYLSIDTLGNKLQQVVSSGLGEVMTVMDKNNKIVTHPDGKQIGMEFAQKESAEKARNRGLGPVDSTTFTNIRTLSAYAEAKGAGGWVVEVSAPVRSILQVAPAATITIFSLMTLSMLIVAVFILSHRVRNPQTVEVIHSSTQESSSLRNDPQLKQGAHTLKGSGTKKRRDTS